MSADGFFSDKVKPGTPEDVKRMQGKKKKKPGDNFLEDWERELAKSMEVPIKAPNRKKNSPKSPNRNRDLTVGGFVRKPPRPRKVTGNSKPAKGFKSFDFEGF
ncbi:hypothetical protein QEH42_gp235 [Microbacterium phage Pumpernickel]|uniref:Uncharacterized protein n=1 Tax=Microbacterium phage Pumpernickel TaxID=2885983 RepID=A0AAE8Y7Q4_9CAUD|nr:hypothetical protein QEH42_gp235 [Microbacterium phage Pumpernickel]UDL15983.1 hypothetical protein SEA_PUMPERNICKEL_233 [Microbacterium phage Pumpernickel]